MPTPPTLNSAELKFCVINVLKRSNSALSTSYPLVHRIQRNLEIPSSRQRRVLRIAAFDVAWLCRARLSISIQPGDHI